MARPGDPDTLDPPPPIAGPSRPAFPVVGIGASAGGLEALESLTQRLHADRIAFVVTPHLAPGHVSRLTDILQRAAKMRVVTVEDRMCLEPGTMYVAPPAVAVSLESDTLRVTAESHERKRLHSIDAFMGSLARAGGPMAIGVLLSGSGSDGTLGLKAIKGVGGITFVQEPSTAAQPGMPQSALDAGHADFALTPAEIGDELMRLAADPYVGRARVVTLGDPDATATIFEQLRAAYGVDFSQYKPTTVERRIGRRIALHKLGSLDEYVALLGSESGELRSLYDDLLIGVTGFFRDSEPFEALKHVVFPRLLEHRGTDAPIRVWVAGCSTGEEAYSVAMALVELLGDRAARDKIQIFATDVDDGALARARLAVYPPSIELDVAPERLRRFFERTDEGFQVQRSVRDLIVFARHNLGKDPPISRLDLVTCRNVLIYLQAPLQKKVLRIFHYALNPAAYLLLGASESVGDSVDLFSLIDRKLKIYVKKDLPSTAVFEFSVARGHPEPAETGDPGRADHRPIVTIAQIADRKVIEKYAPPGVIVDERLDILQFRGRTGGYLEPAPGAATLNLLKLARPEILVALRAVTHRALTEGLPASSSPVSLCTEHGTRTVSLEVMPLPDTGGRKCLLVLFHEGVEPAPPAEPHGAERSKESNPRVLELERELATSKEYLQSTIEELEAANEELQSANEELQSANEELQSSNEELESTNEELATVNDELHNRMAQLTVANDDLQNTLATTEAVIVIVGHDLRIRRFSAAAEHLLSLIPGDIGRSIAYLRNVVSAGDLEQTAAAAISQVTTHERRVRCVDGAWYMVKMVPYVTAEQAIRGLIVEFTRTASQAEAADGADGGVLAQRVLSVLPHAVMVFDRQLRLVWANRTFFEAFAIGPAAVGRSLSEAWGGASEPAELWSFLEDLALGRAPARDLVVARPFGRTADRSTRFIGRVVPGDSGRPPLAVVTMQEA